MKINCHCHIFSLDCVPGEFRERFFLDIRKPSHRLIHRLLKIILPDGSNLETWFDFIDLSIEEIAQRLVREMDETRIDLCTPLMMDMEFCEVFGGSIKSFEEQMAETVETVVKINMQYGRARMLPFIAVDPRRENVIDIVLEALEKKDFKGIKIYPVMGYTPNDRRIYPIYEYCMEKGIPITSHCENGGIPGLKDYFHLANPKYWDTVLKDFPELTLNLAHNDRTGSNWQLMIAELIMRYPNVYTDVSYDTEMFYKPGKYFRSIKKMLNTPQIRSRILYGTDWYMGRCFWTEKSYIKWFTTYSRKIPWCRVKFTNDELRLMMEHNPLKFLGLS